MGRGRQVLVVVALLGAGLVSGAHGAIAAPSDPAPAPSKAPVFIPKGTAPAVPARKARPASVMGATAVIGVDHGGRLSGAVDDVLIPPPAGKNWEYTAYFPSVANVTPGQVVDFHWNAGSLNGEHSVTFLGVSPPVTDPPLIEKDAASNEDITPATTYNSTGQCVVAPGVPPPAAPCGVDLGVPFAEPFTSGLIFNQSAADFIVRIDPATPSGTYFYFCTFHPGQFGRLVVGLGADSQATLDARANTELRSLNATALVDEQTAQRATAPSVANPDGTRTWTVKVGLTSSTAGVAGSQVELLGTFPSVLPIVKGDSVKFQAATFNEIHTVTFPHGAPGAPLAVVAPGVCDNFGPETAADPHGFFPQFGCSNFTTFESPWLLGPQGASSSIPSGSTAASSGALSASGEFGIPTTKTYTFPNNGTFTYFCQLHLDVVATVYTSGYRMTASDGGKFAFGGEDFLGSEGATVLNQPVVGAAETPDVQGYWEVASDGGIFTHGDAAFLGSEGATPLNKPIVGMAATPAAPLFGAPPGSVPATRGGYWEVASDGGVFSFGDAVFFGSLGAIPLNKPIVGMAPTPSGQGYWMVATDGGVFSFGDAVFFGSLGAIALNKPIVGMAATPDGQGYWLVASDGGVFSFGDAHFFGSTGAIALNKPIVGMAATADGQGYWLGASDGGMFTFGDAHFFGSTGAVVLTKPIVAIAGS